MIVALLSAVMIVVGTAVFVTSDRPSNTRGITGFVMYMAGWIIAMLDISLVT